jgi:hypothetical protein
MQTHLHCSSVNKTLANSGLMRPRRTVSPNNHYLYNQRQIKLGHTTHLQGFDMATVLEYMVERFTLPATLIQANRFDSGFKTAHRLIYQKCHSKATLPAGGASSSATAK